MLIFCTITIGMGIPGDFHAIKWNFRILLIVLSMQLMRGENYHQMETGTPILYVLPLSCLRLRLYNRVALKSS